jgi:NADH-quinone oxidoreductase subunit N
VSSLVLQPGVLGPLVWVVLGALVIVVGERALARRESFLGRPITAGYAATLLGFVAIASLAIAAYIAATHAATGVARAFQPALPRLRLDPYSSLVFAWIAAAAAFTCAASLGHLPVRRAHRGDYYALVLFATAGAFLLVSALDLVVLFLGVELLGLCLVALVGFDVRDARGQEAALKLGVVGAVASAVLLYGMALLFAAGGGTDFASVREAVGQGSGLARAGVGLVLAGFATRLATVPFHAWSADVTEGAPRPVAAFVWTVAFTAGVAALLRFATLALGEPDPRFVDVMRVFAGLSLFVGACMAWIQQSPRRLLAYLGVAHAGFLWIGFAVANEQAATAILFQLAAFGAALLGAITVLIALSHRGLGDRIDSFAGVARAQPGLAALLTLFLFSLAGLPGTAGFVGRMSLLLAALREGEAAIVLVALGASAVVFAAVIRIPRELYLRPLPRTPLRAGELASGEVVVLVVCTAVVVALGIAPTGGFPGFDVSVVEWIRNAVVLGLSG